MNGLAERTRSRTENIRLPPTLPPQTRLKVSNQTVRPNYLWDLKWSKLQGAGFGYTSTWDSQRIEFVLFCSKDLGSHRAPSLSSPSS